MKKKGSKNMVLSNQQIEKEFGRMVIRSKRRRVILRSISAVLVLSAAAVIISACWLPIYSVTGSSMEPTLQRGQLVVGYRTQDIKPGDIAIFYYENQILLRRVIGKGGDWIHIDPQGAVFINGEKLQEAYTTGSSAGKSDLTYPYQVQENSYFVLGDNRAVSADSRLSAIGTVSKDKMVGKILFCIPLFLQTGLIEQEGGR